mmetsp:Transcript_1707/g.3289  ORF Transcript_1707/g.3289 Transcript_1707/m.3289 type:complete len:329 (-) Transcript_1707:250-1236(-)
MLEHWRVPCRVPKFGFRPVVERLYAWYFRDFAEALHEEPPIPAVQLHVSQKVFEHASPPVHALQACSFFQGLHGFRELASDVGILAFHHVVPILLGILVLLVYLVQRVVDLVTAGALACALRLFHITPFLHLYLAVDWHVLVELILILLILVVAVVVVAAVRFEEELVLQDVQGTVEPFLLVLRRLHRSPDAHGNIPGTFSVRNRGYAGEGTHQLVLLSVVDPSVLHHASGPPEFCCCADGGSVYACGCASDGADVGTHGVIKGLIPLVDRLATVECSSPKGTVQTRHEPVHGARASSRASPSRPGHRVCGTSSSPWKKYTNDQGHGC